MGKTQEKSMSSFIQLTKNPVTGLFENAEWLDDWFGHRRYGVRFSDGNVFNPDIIKMEVKERKARIKKPAN